jgi:hypothetical protein
MSVQYCVARCNEDVGWIASASASANVLIYNKGARLNLPNEVILPNVGRESHTYLHHIIENYDNLCDITVFAQGRIHDHGYEHDIRGFDGLIAQCRSHGHSTNHRICECATAPNYFSPDFNMLPELAPGLHHAYMVDATEIMKIPFSAWFKQNTGYEYKGTVFIYVAGIFAMSKQQILTRPKEYYESLQKQLCNCNAPIEGHFMERSWYYVFRCAANQNNETENNETENNETEK